MRARFPLVSAASVAFAALVVVACATLGDEGPIGVNLPNSGVGPFRKLGTTEVPGTAPYVLDVPGGDYQEPSALALSDDTSSASVALYVAGQVPGENPHGVIARTRADDARSFYGTSSDTDAPGKPQTVLDVGEAWEGANLHSPAALRVGGTIYLYYAGSGGIGVATATDGLTFSKHGSPVFVADPTVAWESGATPTEPSVAVFPSGTWHMLYAAGTSIGEATSPDGLTWTRMDADPSTPAIDPVLVPQAFDAAALTDDASPPFDSGQVADPCFAQRVTPAGRLDVLVLYTGYAAAIGDAGSGSPQPSAIGLAGRYGETGPLARSGAPVYSVDKHERAPTVFDWSVGTMLYVAQDSAYTPPYPAVAAGIAPASITLPTPTGYASGP
jgi:hypothetical protein